MDVDSWSHCSSCKGDIGFGETYYVCSVSTCQRKGSDFRFCSVECWDMHVPTMRHREAWAEENRSPTRAAWEREHPPGPKAPASPPPHAAATATATRAAVPAGEPERDILVVVSKMKAYVRARSGMNTSDAFADVLSDWIRSHCDEAIRSAEREGRRTVLDRDLRRPR